MERNRRLSLLLGNGQDQEILSKWEKEMRIQFYCLKVTNSKAKSNITNVEVEIEMKMSKPLSSSEEVTTYCLKELN